MSAFQFSMTLSAKIETKQAENKSLCAKIHDLVLGTEIWALLVILITQDLPFFVIRLLILFSYDKLQKNYNLYFFVVKNFILVIFEFYYIISIVIERKMVYKTPKTTYLNTKDVEIIDIDKEIQISRF